MDGRAPTYDELLELTRRQARQIDELRSEVERLKAELDRARRAGKRQAAPFSKGPPKAAPRRPGREAGHPPNHRPPPPPEQVDRTVEVPLPKDCPECHAAPDGAPTTIHDQYQIDLPEPRPVITRFRVPVARCPACFRRVQGRHPEQTSDALGAAAVQYGPRPLRARLPSRHSLQPACTRRPGHQVRPSHSDERLPHPEAARSQSRLHRDGCGPHLSPNRRIAVPTRDSG